MVASL